MKNNRYIGATIVGSILVGLLISANLSKAADEKDLGDAKNSPSTERVTLDAPITKSDLKILDKRVQFTFLDGTLKISSIIYVVEGIGEVVFYGPDAADILSFAENAAVRDAKINASINK